MKNCDERGKEALRADAESRLGKIFTELVQALAQNTAKYDVLKADFNVAKILLEQMLEALPPSEDHEILRQGVEGFLERCTR